GRQSVEHDRRQSVEHDRNVARALSAAHPMEPRVREPSPQGAPERTRRSRLAEASSAWFDWAQELKPGRWMKRWSQSDTPLAGEYPIATFVRKKAGVREA